MDNDFCAGVMSCHNIAAHLNTADRQHCGDGRHSVELRKNIKIKLSCNNKNNLVECYFKHFVTKEKHKMQYTNNNSDSNNKG